MRVKNASAVKMIGAIKNSYSSKISTKELVCVIRVSAPDHPSPASRFFNNSIA